MAEVFVHVSPMQRWMSLDWVLCQRRINEYVRSKTGGAVAVKKVWFNLEAARDAHNGRLPPEGPLALHCYPDEAMAGQWINTPPITQYVFPKW